MKPRRIAAWVGSILVLAILGVSSPSLLFVLRGAATFPPLSGEYGVGYKQLHLVDIDRPEILSPDPDDLRELMVDVHYPTDATGAAAPYVERHLAVPLLGLPYLLLTPIRPNRIADAPVAASGGPYPLLIFSPGLGGLPLYYSSLLEQVASHGYIVAALHHPYSTDVTVFPDGRRVTYNVAGSDAMFTGTEAERDAATQTITRVWAEDAGFVADALLDHFDGAADASAIGAFGHSFGGQNAAAAMARDECFLAGLNMDGTFLYQPVLDEGVDGAFMFVYSAFEPPYQYLEESGTTIDAWRERWTARNRPPAITDNAARTYTLVIDGAAHDTFATDLALLQPMFWFIVPKKTVGDIEGEQVLNLLTVYITAFFDRHLRGQESPLLDQVPSPYPEVRVGAEAIS